MDICIDDDRCLTLGLKNGQKKQGHGFRYSDLWWSFDGGRTAFGQGDLDDKDLKHIFDWLTERYRFTQKLEVFTGWFEHHMITPHFKQGPALRISMSAGVTNPYTERVLMTSYIGRAKGA